MIKLALRGAAIVAAGSALALAGGLVPAQAATSGWRTNATVAVSGSETIFTDVAASSPSDAWAVGFSAKDKGNSVAPTVIRRWTGKAWRAVTLPGKVARAWERTDAVESPVGAASARSVWVFGSVNGSYLRLSGGQWSIGRLPGAGSASSGTLVYVDAVKVFSSTDVWAFGVREALASGSTEPYAAQYNGHKWSTETVPGSGAITAVAAVSAKDIWAVESTDSSGLLASAEARPARAASPAARSAAARLRAASSTATAPVVVQWTGSSWQDAAQQPALAATDQLVSAVAEPGGIVWFGGSAKNSAKGTSPLTAEWNGTAWSVKDLPGKASSAAWEIGSMAPDGTGGIWALVANTNAERIWHLNGATWSQAKPAFGKHAWVLEAVAVVPGTHSAWGVGAVQGRTKSSANGLIAVDGSLPR